MPTGGEAIAMQNKYIKTEWRDSDGYWIELRSGWCDDGNPACHTIVENTRKAAYQHRAVVCVCVNCQREARLER